MTDGVYESVRYRSLDGRAIVVTGGASGIGAAMVRAFAAQGARVDFLDVDAASAGPLAAETGATFHRCDVTDIDALRTTLAQIETTRAGVDVLVNNAARDDRQVFAEIEPDDWRRMLAVNLDHQFFATQAVAKAMAARGRGSIIMFGSISWMRGRTGMASYTAAKAAINGMTRTFARELGPSGIRVNCIVPGAIRTQRQAKLWRTPELDRQLIEQQALRFTLDESHVARVALFLASDESAACTGTNFIVDAGLTLS